MEEYIEKDAKEDREGRAIGAESKYMAVHKECQESDVAKSLEPTGQDDAGDHTGGQTSVLMRKLLYARRAD